MKFVPSLALSLAVLLAGCASTSYINDKVKTTKGDLRGMVYDLDRTPVSQAKVTLRSTNQVVSTDVHGHFVLPEVPFGTVELLLEKVDYEPYRWTVDFGEVSQVVYVQMADAAQLFDAAADALELRQWDDAGAYLERARTLEPDSPNLALLGAFLASRQGHSDAAVALLERYLLAHPRNPLLELATADLYERELKQIDKALAHLEAAQTLRYDPEVDLRIRKMRGVGE